MLNRAVTILLMSYFVCNPSFATTPPPAKPATPPATTTSPAKPATPPATTTSPAKPATPPAATTSPAKPATPPAATTSPAKPATPPAKTAPPTQTQIDTEADAAAVKTINDQLKIAVKSVAEINPAITQLYVDYYAKLRQCTPGTYKYALPLPTGGSYHADTGTIDPLYYFPVTVIHGMQNHKCAVDTTFQLLTIGTIEVKCLYQEDSLKQFTEADAKYTVNGNVDTVSPSSRADGEQCHISIDGTPYN